MKLIQYTGPFSAGEVIKAPAETDRIYTHIGIQIPNRESMINLVNSAIPLDIVINEVQYRINDTGILEFDEMSEISCTIQFLQDMPMETIIDISYKMSDI